MLPKDESSAQHFVIGTTPEKETEPIPSGNGGWEMPSQDLRPEFAEAARRQDQHVEQKIIEFERAASSQGAAAGTKRRSDGSGERPPKPMKSSSTADAGSSHSAMYDLTKTDMEIMVTTMVRPSGVRTQRSSTPTFRRADTSPQRSPSRARPAAPKKMAADVAQSPLTEKPEGLPTPSAAAVAQAPSTPPTRAPASRSPAPQSRADAESPPPGLGKP